MTARVSRDLTISAAALAGLFLIEWQFSVFDSLVDRGDLGPVDEIMLGLSAVTTVALMFALRRVADLRDKIRRLAEADRELSLSEARARILFDKAPQPMWVFDVETCQILAVNEAAVARYGYSHDEFVQLTILDLRPENDRAAVIRLVESLRGQQGQHFGLHRHRLRSGQIIDVDVASHAVQFDGRPARLVVAVDVTKREQALRALQESDARLQESDARFRQLAATIPSVFYLMSADRQILYISPAYEKVWEASSQSLQARPDSYLDRVHPEDREAAARGDRDMFSRPTEVEYRLCMPDGRVKWILDVAFPVRDASGAVYRVAGVASDVTAQKRLEAELTEIQKMESVGRLAGGVAHDFNNLLTVILSQAAILGDAIVEPEAREEVRQIQQAAERAAALTRQLLAFARRQLYEPRVVDLNTLVADTERLLTRLIGEDIELVIRRSPRPATVRADAGSLEQVLMNLAANSRDAMPGGGHLTIAIEETIVDVEAADCPREAIGGPHVVLTIADTGSGIADEHLPHLFEPFFTTKPQGQGTGLGLSTVYGIVRQAGGHIRVTTSKDRGTAIAIHLPRVIEPAATQSTIEMRLAPGGGETLLLVEDEPSVRTIAARVLTMAGYRVLVAGDGAEALQLFDELADRIALVVTDVVMPRMGGPELAARLRLRRPELKILFTSGYTQDALVLQEMDQSQAFLQKPYMPAALTARVRALLDAPVGTRLE